MLFPFNTIALPKAEVSRLRAVSAASIVAAKGRSFRLTRSAFSLLPLATKASLPKGLSIRPLDTFGIILLLLCFSCSTVLCCLFHHEAALRVHIHHKGLAGLYVRRDDSAGNERLHAGL